MCGILGSLPAIDTTLFRKGLDKIAHRGPDGFGIWEAEEKQVLLGHRRLAIVDLSDCGKQPMLYAKYVIVFNGEIYNYVEIKRELQQKGYKFETESDTEVIMAAYDYWGHACLDKFNGMWSLAIWNKETKKLFITRDRFGKKPFFYAFIKGHLVFGSEMKALLPFLEAVAPSKDFDWCRENPFLYEQTNKSLVQGIQRFPAASYAYISTGENELKPIRYWNTLDHIYAVPKTYKEQVEAYRELFINACAIRMRSDVSIGTALSGGMDSSAVICTMAHIEENIKLQGVNKDWQHAFVACFKDSEIDEKVYAEKVVNKLGISATYLEIDPAQGVNQLLHDLYMFEELYITSPIPMMRTYGAIKQNGVTVSIDGHGADEIMSGYKEDMLEAILDAGVNLPQIFDILETYKGVHKIPDSKWNAAEKFDVYKKAVRRRMGSKSNILKFYLKSFAGKNKPSYSKYPDAGFFNNRLFDLFNVSVLPTLLRNYDRYSMAASVEIRMPFMDHRLVAFSFSLPWNSKIRNGYSKSIIRDAIGPFMPKEIVQRKDKIGFTSPNTEWIRGPWKEFFLDHISSADFNNCSLIDAKEVRSKVEKVVFGASPTNDEGEAAWYSMQPYFWEIAFLKHKE